MLWVITNAYAKAIYARDINIYHRITHQPKFREFVIEKCFLNIDVVAYNHFKNVQFSNAVFQICCSPKVWDYRNRIHRF